MGASKSLRLSCFGATATAVVEDSVRAFLPAAVVKDSLRAFLPVLDDMSLRRVGRALVALELDFSDACFCRHVEV